jgi:hypothetical protein
MNLSKIIYKRTHYKIPAFCEIYGFNKITFERKCLPAASKNKRWFTPAERLKLTRLLKIKVAIIYAATGGRRKRRRGKI